MDIYFDKEKGVWDVLEQPYCTVEFPTKEDYDRFVEMVDFWNKNHKEVASDGEETQNIPRQ